MENNIKFLYDFILLFFVILIVYIVFINKRKKEYSKLKKNDIVKSFIIRYDLDMRKHNYKRLLTIVAIINSFIIAFTATLILNVENYFWKLVVCFLVLFILVYSLYELLGRIYKKSEEKKNV